MLEETKKKNWYDRNYKSILIVPALLLIFSIVYLFNFNIKNEDIVYKDVSLTGGTSVTLIDSNVDLVQLKDSLISKFDDIAIRQISDFGTGSQKGLVIETKADAEEIKKALEEYLGYELNQKNSSIEFSGSALSLGFYQQLRIAIIIAFTLMAIVVFIIFKTFVPSFAVILSAFVDIVMTIVTVDLFGMHLSIAGIIGFLMLIGYSVDTDILLTSRVVKRSEGTVNEKIYGAFKTGITMTLTSMAAVGVSLIIIYSLSNVLRQIFTILLIGLIFDIFNTWVTNASIIKWYAESKRRLR